MKESILFLSHSDDGGAGRANLNIAKAFISLGHEVQFLVVEKKTNEEFVTQVTKIRKVKKQKSYSERAINLLFSKLKIFQNATPIVQNIYVEKYCYYNDDETKSEFEIGEIKPFIKIKPDIIFGGWISLFVNLNTIGLLGKLYSSTCYVIMNDMAPLTGGCHYNWECDGYKKDCSNCPAIEGTDNSKRSQENLLSKKKSIEKYNIQVIAGSKANIIDIKSSILYKKQKNITHINGILDFTLYNSKKRTIAKTVFDLPIQSKVILGGASFLNEKRKGFDLLEKVFAQLNKTLILRNKEVTFLLLGRNNVYNFKFSNINLKEYNNISDKILFPLFYQAADVYVSPSIQDTGPAMVVEALACGTPVVGFDIGFVNDFVVNGKNGYIVPNYDVTLFAEKIYDILFENNAEELCKNSVESIQLQFSSKQLENFNK